MIRQLQLYSLTAVAFASGSLDFDDFCAQFGKVYERGSAEYTTREAIFHARLREINSHNNAEPAPKWWRGVNQFSDMTAEEFKQAGPFGYNKQLAAAWRLAGREEPPTAPVAASSSLPPRIDWREKGVVSGVKDQGRCGSCWAFGTTATIESHVALTTGTLEVLSPQQLVSCAPNPLSCGGVGGCEGSIPEVAYEYIQLYGMTSEWMMPYTSYFGDSSTCNFNRTRTPAKVSISGYKKLPPNDYDAVMRALVEVGPLAINVQADVWQDYKGGVFDGCSNSSNVDIDHVVQLVGYGTDAKLGDYWLVRNSWDSTWGEKGYIRLKRTPKAKCGVDPNPQDGTGCAGGAPTQTVCGECGILFDVSYPVGAALARHKHNLFV
eukprot:gnl/TRDRNA2_/TRDRNA2_30284_c0_seq1.p1 gnl/TRDRNA2_/TRDRNA2_30284_c0~~gnl/TRDRNA2_/TRDRNA2_30284_c0_seq1.p1  ORF type:complete len:378 (-),score=64.69 gnl/TRDRNA2_/TRDRNA2_30284_c0_seq1:46-1179(-)